MKLWMLKDEALPMTKLCSSGCSLGKNPFVALTRFPLQSGQEGAAGPKHLCPHVPMMVTCLPRLGPFGQMTTGACLPLALEPAAEPLGDVQHLI